MLKRVILAFLLSQPDTISPTPAISIGVCEGSFTINAHSVLYFLVVGCPEVSPSVSVHALSPTRASRLANSGNAVRPVINMQRCANATRPFHRRLRGALVVSCNRAG